MFFIFMLPEAMCFLAGTCWPFHPMTSSGEVIFPATADAAATAGEAR
jgi:hypothetical protein